MADRCKHCGSKAVTWTIALGKWVLVENDGGRRHRCAGYKKTYSQRNGEFLRLYGPRTARTHAVMVQTAVPMPDTPRAMFDELNNEERWPAYFHLANRT